MNKGVKDVSALHVARPTMVVWDLDDADRSGSSSDEGSTSTDHDQFGLRSSNSLEEDANTPQERISVLDDDDEDIIQLHGSALAEGSRSTTTTLAEEEGSSRSGMRGIRPSTSISMSQALASFDLLDDLLLLRSDEQDDHSSVMTQDSIYFEEFEECVVDLNDEPGPHYRSFQGNFHRLALSLGLGNHDSSYSEATDDDSSC